MVTGIDTNKQGVFMNVFKSLVVLCALSASNTLIAKELWSNNSLTLLHGNDYEVGDNKKTVLTGEHVSGHTWGDVFVFVDRLHHYNNDNHETYGEFGANFTLFKPQHDFIKETYLATQWEFASQFSQQTHNYLAGVGMNLNVPGTQYFKVNLYRRFNDHGQNNMQLTLAWSRPFKSGILYDGFIDAINSTSTSSAGFNFTSQLKYDIGQHFSYKANKLFAGVEYVFWKHKYGIDGITEKNANLLLKWHF
jgi:nucleoside-specific outer membrane channel protein Tsx